MDYIEEYGRAQRAGEKALRKARSEGRNPFLPSLAQVFPEYESLTRIPLGVMEIPLEMVIGTVSQSRQNSFAWNFLPVFSWSTEFSGKWIALYEAQQEEGIRDPIKCYEYMNRFYVLEGNKRVSVLKYIGAGSVTAKVERIIPRRNMDKENIAYFEFLEFFKVTHFYGICLTGKGDYERLAQHYGCTLTEEWDEERVADLKSDFQLFSKVFTKKAGKYLSMSAGEAYLVYLDVYKQAPLLEIGDAEIARNIANIRNELLTTVTTDEIALIEEPEQKKKNPILGMLTLPYTKEEPLKAVFIYSKTPGTSRWAYGHELGRNEVEDYFGGTVVTEAYTDCDTEELVDQAFNKAFTEGADVVFTTTPFMMEASVRAAVRYPALRIMNCSINMVSNAVRCYYPCLYEVKFLMGMIAAAYAEDHRIGYLADYPLNGNIANINAFAIGAGMIDPKAEIILKWSGVKNYDWREEFRKEGINLISGPDIVQPDDASRRYGVYKTWHDGRVQNIAAPIIDWGKFYRKALTMIMDGHWENREHAEKNQAINYWFGLRNQAIDLIVSDGLPYSSLKMLNAMKDSVMAGIMKPFKGTIYSQQGLVEVDNPEGLSREQIITMNWLNENIRGSIPSKEELVDSIQTTAVRSGV